MYSIQKKIYPASTKITPDLLIPYKNHFSIQKLFHIYLFCSKTTLDLLIPFENNLLHAYLFRSKMIYPAHQKSFIPFKNYSELTHSAQKSFIPFKNYSELAYSAQKSSIHYQKLLIHFQKRFTPYQKSYSTLTYSFQKYPPNTKNSLSNILSSIFAQKHSLHTKTIHTQPSKLFSLPQNNALRSKTSKLTAQKRRKNANATSKNNNLSTTPHFRMLFGCG